MLSICRRKEPRKEPPPRGGVLSKEGKPPDEGGFLSFNLENDLVSISNSDLMDLFEMKHGKRDLENETRNEDLRLKKDTWNAMGCTSHALKLELWGGYD